jgi:hypothetical protein
MPMPSSARTNAVALETDLKDKSAVVERTTRTRLDGGCVVVEPCTQFLSQAGGWADNPKFNPELSDFVIATCFLYCTALMSGVESSAVPF